MNKRTKDREISQAEHEKQGAWLEVFAHEQRDYVKLKRLAEEFGYRLVPK